ncbi:MAG: hypothetical protein WBB82_07560, partial [Limnothrix sp.]
MSHPRFIQIAIDSEHPDILAGLDSLVSLGLLRDGAVRSIAENYFSSKLPDPLVITETLLPEPEPKIVEPKIPAAPTVFERFLEELSVRWLLFLGVFLVVLSSGVLVASQWENFPVVGQYLVLWSYTVIFGLVGFWASKQQELNLTARTLQSVAMLLVPLNFWAVDEFNIWQSILQSVVAIAAIIFLSFGVRIFATSRDWSKPILGGFLALGLFHWGWGTVLSPVIGVYLGIAAVIVILWGVPLWAKRAHPQKIPENIGLEFVLFGLGLLLFRAIAIESIPFGQLGLGVGLLGWLLTELEQDRIQRFQPPESKALMAHPWETAGAVLLVLSWLATVGRYEWQVVGVSGLAAAWLLQKLRRNWQVGDLVALFVVGLQGGILCRHVIPTGFKASVTTAAVEFSQAQSFPYTIYSVALLPYVVIWAIAAIWFYRTDKKDLARVSEYLLLGLGVILAGLSLPNATWRFLNFFVATGIGFYFTHYSRSYIRRNYLYLCHGMGLLVIGSLVERVFPDLNALMWGNIFLIGLMAETAFCILPTRNHARQMWQKSSWYFGILLSLASFAALAAEPLNGASPLLRLTWVIVPCLATVVGWRKKRLWRRQAIAFSTGALIFLPLLGTTLIGAGFEDYLTNSASLLFLRIAAAIAVGLMFFNVRLVATGLFTHLHLTFGTAFVVSLIFQRVTGWEWLIMASIASGTFWSVAAILRQRQYYLGQLYRRIYGQWGFVFGGLVALFLTQHYLEIWNQFWDRVVHPEVFVSSGLLLIIVLVRYWQNPKNEAFILGGIALEAGLAEGVFLQGEYPLAIAVGNLGLAALFWGLKRQLPQLQQISLWRAYPLLFTVLGLIWRLSTFNALTGLLMLGFSFVTLAIASDYNSRFLRFFGFASITWGVYETVIYQMLQSTGNNLGNALTVLAFVGIILALIYRSLYWLRSSKSLDTIATIPIREILIVAHIHWAIAATFKLFTLPYFLPEPPSFRIMAIAVNICLALYAFIQAQNHSHEPD